MCCTASVLNLVRPRLSGLNWWASQIATKCPGAPSAGTVCSAQCRKVRRRPKLMQGSASALCHRPPTRAVTVSLEIKLPFSQPSFPDAGCLATWLTSFRRRSTRVSTGPAAPAWNWTRRHVGWASDAMRSRRGPAEPTQSSPHCLTARCPHRPTRGRISRRRATSRRAAATRVAGCAWTTPFRRAPIFFRVATS